MPIARSRHPPPDTTAAAPLVSILHPGYDDAANLLLTLPAVDNNGIHYGTALTFCGIIAGNTYDTGFFATTREAEAELAEWDSLLVGPVYYYFTGRDRKSRYPIYTCFKEWCFPPSLPAPWREYAIPPIADTRLRKVPERDSSCRLTLHADGCEIAHLVPTVDQEWFAHNQINRFVNQGDPQAINHHANAILLRADLHHLMDQRVWVPTLKEKKLLLCSMCKPPATPLSAHFRTLYQNCELQELKGVSKECIFARVAWAVMPLVKAFLQSRATEKSETTAVFDASGKEVYLSAASLQLKTIEASKSASRSASPKKRVRSADSAQDDAYNPQCCSWASFNDSAYGEVSGGYEYEACRHRSPSRGRKRRRVHRGSSDDEGLEMSEILARAVGEKQHMPKESIKEQSERNVDGLSATR